MNFLRKLEKKFGRYAIPNLMYYIIIMYGMGLIIYVANPNIYFQYLSLDVGAILQGQIWRIVTFLICPPSMSSDPMTSVLLSAIAMSLYYFLGRTLEQVWGIFRFNLYFLMGILGHIVAAFILYFATWALIGVPVTAEFCRILPYDQKLPEDQSLRDSEKTEIQIQCEGCQCTEN